MHRTYMFSHMHHFDTFRSFRSRCLALACRHLASKHPAVNATPPQRTATSFFKGIVGRNTAHKHSARLSYVKRTIAVSRCWGIWIFWGVRVSAHLRKKSVEKEMEVVEISLQKWQGLILRRRRERNRLKGIVTRCVWPIFSAKILHYCFERLRKPYGRG